MPSIGGGSRRSLRAQTTASPWPFLCRKKSPPFPSPQPLTGSGDRSQGLHQGLEAIILLRSGLEQKGRGLERDLWGASADQKSILLVHAGEGRQLLGLRP